MIYRFKHLAAGVAALALTAAPVATSAQTIARDAGTNSAAGLSVGATRTGSTPVDASAVRGGSSTLINLGIFAALVVGILVATTTGDNDDDTPDSP